MDRRTRLLVGAGALAAALAAWLVSPDAVLARLAWLAADPLRFGLALAALAAARPLLALPTTLLAVAAGYGYGLAGFPAALALVVLTSVPPFLLARRARGVDARIERAGAACERFVGSAGDLRSVAASRLLPAPSDVVSAAAGAADVRVAPFLAGTALGEVPWVAAGVLAGASLETLSGGLAGAIDPRLVVAAALAAAALLGPPAYREFVAGGPGALGDRE